MSSISKLNIYNLTLTNADTEYSQALAPFCKSLTIFARPAGDGSLPDLKVATISGNSGTTYFSVIGGYKEISFPSGNGFAGTLTLYIQSPTAGTVVEILAWT